MNKVIPIIALVVFLVLAIWFARLWFNSPTPGAGTGNIQAPAPSTKPR